jgi:single-stranded DNA-binding protein
VARNRIELEGRVLDLPEIRSTPAGTPVLRFSVECGVPGEELILGVIAVGEPALAAKPLLKRDGQVRVSGRMRALKGKLKSGATIEVVAESIERNEPEKA